MVGLRLTSLLPDLELPQLQSNLPHLGVKGSVFRLIICKYQHLNDRNFGLIPPSFSLRIGISYDSIQSANYSEYVQISQ